MRSAALSDPNAVRTTRPIAPVSRRAAKRRCNACSKTCRASHPVARQRCAPSRRRLPRKRSLHQPHQKAESPQPTPAKPPPPAATAKTDTETAAPPAAAKTATAPKAAASAPAKKPSSTQVAAIRSACRSDYQQNCAGVPTGGAAALSCLEKNKANLSASCQKAVSAASSPATGGAPADAATASPDAAPAGAAPALVLRPMRPREVIFALRSGCGEDARALCGDI